jgi:transposase
MFRMKEKEKLFVAAVTAGVFIIVAFGSSVFIVNKVLAQDLFIYPEKGQSQEQIEKD